MPETRTKRSFALSAKPVVLTSVVLAILIIGFISARKYVEWEEVDIPVGYSAEAIAHDLLASRRYLQAFDYQVTDITDLDFYKNLPPADSVILSSYLPTDLPESLYDNLRQWINDGGHLITGVSDSHSSSDQSAYVNFIHSFGISTRSVYWEQAEELDGIYSLTTATDSEAVSVYLNPLYAMNLSDTGNAIMAAGNDDDYYFLQLQDGTGYFTVTADSYLFSNWSIGDSDNALLLSRLIETTNPSDIWISDSPASFTGVFTLIWERFKWLVLVLAALLLAILRRESTRLGPLQTLSDNRSSNFSQHLLAMAGFQFRHGNTDRLLESTRARVIRIAQGNTLRSDKEINVLLATKTSIHESDISNALYGKINNSNELITATITLQTVLKKLNAGQSV